MDLERIATYLNLATDKLKETPNLSWITGVETPITLGSTAESQETQCMQIQGAIWIANNEDADSTTQRNFLNALGIRTLDELSYLSIVYGAHLLPFHKGTLALKKTYPKVNLLAYMIGGTEHPEQLEEAEHYEVLTTATNTSYALSSVTPPPVSGIVFVSGSYQGDEATQTNSGQHAEQKLLAALGKYMQANPTFGATVYLGGIKMPCSKCDTVVNAVAARLRFRVEIRQDLTTTLRGMRSKAKISVKSATGIRQLNVDHYFPE